MKKLISISAAFFFCLPAFAQQSSPQTDLPTADNLASLKSYIAAKSSDPVAALNGRVADITQLSMWQRDLNRTITQMANVQVDLNHARASHNTAQVTQLTAELNAFHDVADLQGQIASKLAGIMLMTTSNVTGVRADLTGLLSSLDPKLALAEKIGIDVNNQALKPGAAEEAAKISAQLKASFLTAPTVNASSYDPYDSASACLWNYQHDNWGKTLPSDSAQKYCAGSSASAVAVSDRTDPRVISDDGGADPEPVMVFDKSAAAK